MVTKEAKGYRDLYPVVVDDPLDPRFSEPAKSEIPGLLEQKSYEVVSKSEIPDGATILKSRVQHSI